MSHPGHARHCSFVGGTSLCSLLQSWQAVGDVRDLESLLARALPLIERAAAATLRRRHLADPAAVDDVVSRVLDHLRRLPGASAGEKIVARFVPRSGHIGAESLGDRGEAYVVWLARERALDIVRSRRRVAHRISCFSELPAASRTLTTDAGKANAIGLCHAPPGAQWQRLHDAIPLLDTRQRVVIELLLEGKTQAVIAHTLDVCEGTVSRLRSKAIAQLRLLLAE
jgi:RNA polymerase sigma factor (sigma-70 family)